MAGGQGQLCSGDGQSGQGEAGRSLGWWGRDKGGGHSAAADTCACPQGMHEEEDAAVQVVRWMQGQGSGECPPVGAG